jgi:hypothetical protein
MGAHGGDDRLGQLVLQVPAGVRVSTGMGGSPAGSDKRTSRAHGAPKLVPFSSCFTSAAFTCAPL